MGSIGQKKGHHKDDPNWQLHSPENQFYKNMNFFWGKMGVGHTPKDPETQSMVMATRGLLTWIDYPAHCPSLGVGYAGMVKSKGYSLGIQNPFCKEGIE